MWRTGTWRANTWRAGTWDDSTDQTLSPATGHVVYRGYVPRVTRAWPVTPTVPGTKYRRLRQISLPQDHPGGVGGYHQRLSVMLHKYLRELQEVVNLVIDEVDGGGGGGGGGSPSPLRPKFFVGPADAYTTGTQVFLDGATFLSGSSANGKAGSFTLTTTAGNYGWLAVNAAASASGVLVESGGGYGGWSGAGQTGNYSSGDTTDVSSIVVTDSATGASLRLFRQDYVNSSSLPTVFTTS